MVADLRIEIFPDDLDRAVDFYVRVLGFSLMRDERHLEWAYIALELGRVRVGAAWRPSVDTAPRRPPVGVELVLETDDLDAARRRIADEGWPVEDEMQAQPWGLRDFRVLDPSGYYWRLTEHPT